MREREKQRIKSWIVFVIIFTFLHDLQSTNKSNIEKKRINCILSTCSKMPSNLCKSSCIIANVQVKLRNFDFMLFTFHFNCRNCKCTYSVCMLFIESNVPFASDWILLSYNDNKLKLVKSLNESFRMHEISFAFSNSNCNDVNPRNTFVGRFFILLPYKTLQRQIEFS